jgi:uncharacterized protein involved in tolerance to divalent cations
MTEKHRKRLTFAAVTAAVVIVFLTMPVASTAGAGAALIVAAVSVACAAVVLGITAYVWSANDREAAAQSVPPLTQRR